METSYNGVDGAVAEAVGAGILWLYTQEQPKGAALRHGVQMEVVSANRRITLIPEGNHGAPVIVLSVLQQRFIRTGYPGEVELENPLADGEVAALHDWIRDRLDVQVTGTWDGQYESGSVGLARKAHPTLLEAVSRYRAGCQRLGDEHERGAVFCRCGWYRALYERLVQPMWTPGN